MYPVQSQMIQVIQLTSARLLILSGEGEGGGRVLVHIEQETHDRSVNIFLS